MIKLVDVHGRPIETAKLTQEEAGPTIAGVRQVWSSHPSRGLTPSRLAAILLEAEEGDPERYFELAEDMEEKDLHYLGVLGTRKRKVSQLEITVEASSDEARDVQIADELREFIRRDTLQVELFDILDAIGKGISVSEIVWETSARQWRPKCIEWRDPKWFTFDRADFKTLLLRAGAGGVPLTPFKYVTHVVKAKSGLPIRGGLARAIAWVWLFKNFSLKDWVAFSEIFGQPYRIGKYDPSATQDDKDALLRAVTSIGSDAAAIVPKSMLIELLENSGKSGSIDVYDRLTRFLDEQVSKGVLGQTLTTEVTQGGGNRALGEVHANVAEDIQDADAQQLQATLNRDLVRPFVDLNFGPQARYPRILIGRNEELTLPQKLDYTVKLVPLGLKVESSQVRDRLGWDEPATDAAVLTAPAPGAAPPTEEEPPPPPRRAVSAQRIAVHATDDEVSAAVDELLTDDGWQRVIDPIVAPVRDLLRTAATMEEVRDRLVDVVRGMDDSQLVELLADAGFAARVAGALDIDEGRDG